MISFAIILPLHACWLIQSIFPLPYIFVIALLFFAGQTYNLVIYTTRGHNKHVHYQPTQTEAKMTCDIE